MEASEYTEDPGFGILPADDEDLTADQLLDAAVESALEDPLGIPDEEAPPIPFGLSWKFDYQAERFVRVGGSPAEVRGQEALGEWILSVLHTAAGVHPALPLDVGVDNPGEIIGESDPTMQMADWERSVTEALTVHPRIAEVDSLELEWDPEEGMVIVRRMDIITDEEEAVRLLDVPIEPEV